MPLHQIQNLPTLDELRMTEAELKGLATDIAVNGLDQDVVVRRLADGLFELVDGKHRGAAHAEAGFESVPARIRDYTDQDAAVRTILANDLRKDLTPLQQAVDWQNAIDAGLTQAELAQQIGKSPATISKRLGLLQVPTAIGKLAGGLVPFEEIPWFRPLMGHDELAEKVAESIEKDGKALSTWSRVDRVVKCLGIGPNSLGAAPLNSIWAGKVAKVPYWELYGFATDELRKAVEKLDHVTFGTKSSPDLVLVWDVPAAKSLVEEATKDIRDKTVKRSQPTAADKERRLQQQIEAQERDAIDARGRQRVIERLAPIKKLDDDLQTLLARIYMTEVSYGYEVIEGADVDALRQLLGKHADVYAEDEWGSNQIGLDRETYDKLLERSATAAARYLAFAMYVHGVGNSQIRDDVHQALAGETIKQTEAHGRRTAKKLRQEASD